MSFELLLNYIILCVCCDVRIILVVKGGCQGWWVKMVKDGVMNSWLGCFGWLADQNIYFVSHTKISSSHE